MVMPLGRALSAHVDSSPGSHFGRGVTGLPGPIWSMMAWYILIASLMLASLVSSAFSPNDVNDQGLIVFRFAYCIAGVVALGWMGTRTPGWVLRLLLDLNVAVTCLTAASKDSVSTAAVPLTTLMFAAMYAATWFRQREMVAHLALLTALSAAAVFVGSNGPNLRVLWAVILVLCWGLGLFVNALVRDLNRRVMSDPLTGLLNRAGLGLVAANLSGSRAQMLPRSVAVLDFEGFKAYNDRNGHQAGDEILREAGAALRSQLRPNDTPARTGGDEFVVLLPFTTVDDARTVIARVVASLPVGCSFGLADWPAGSTFEEAMHAADHKMYVNKRRNEA